jgi:hypothetical protein
MFRTVTGLQDRKTPDTWVRRPGVIRGCDIYVHDKTHFGVMPGTMLFTNGKTARINNVTSDVCHLPGIHGPMMYIVAMVSDKDLIFRCVDVKDPSIHITSGLPVYMSSGIVVARIRIPDDLETKSIKVYQIAPEGEGHSITDFFLYPDADGKRSRFYLPDNIYSKGSVCLMVNSILQVEGEDFVVNSEPGIDGKNHSVIDFINDIPAAGSDMRVTFYIGKAAADEIR